MIMQKIQTFQDWGLIKINELIISIPILLLTIFFLYKLNPRYCSRCRHGTYFPHYQYLQNNPNWPEQRYCLKCFFWINLAKWNCDSCDSSGTHRIHELGFLDRFLIVKQRKKPYKICQCGNIVELKQQ